MTKIRDKLGKFVKGAKHPKEWLGNFKGKKHSQSTKLSISKSMEGRTLKEDTKKKISASRQRISILEWKKYIKSEKQRLRLSKKFMVWRKLVFERDNYVCQECKIKGKRLHPHHIKSFANFSELRFDVNNGQTLCEDCHKKIHYS